MAFRFGVAHAALLLDKYREILRLRHAEASGDGGDPTADLRALSVAFPGALRELDRLPLAELEARVAALVAWDGRSEPPPWAPGVARFHGWLRAALRRRAQPPAPRDADGPAYADEPTAAEWSAALDAQIRTPPGGRLSAWAASRTAEELGLEPTVLLAWLGVAPRDGSGS